MTTDKPVDPASAIVDADGRPIRRPGDQRCPRCQASPSIRVPSAGFGRRVHDVCGQCGYDFTERTITPEREQR
jgi:predicted Zn-ribbon and HTH transcriptional regulator